MLKQKENSAIAKWYENIKLGFKRIYKAIRINYQTFIIF